MQPTAKRLKLDPSAEMEIKAILAKEYSGLIPLEMVFVSTVTEKKNISIIMQELSKLLPLQGMQHLKRVHQNKVITCRVKDLVGVETAKQYFEQMKVSSAIIAYLCSQIETIKVPANQPKLRWQYEAMQQYWPTKFHPDKYLESLYTGTNFTKEQANFHKKLVRLALRLSQKLEINKPVAICIDPRTNSIVAIATSKTDFNPIMHAPMLLIDFVARTQNAGSWNDKIKDIFVADDNTVNDKSMAGILKRHYDFVQNEDEFEDLQFGAERLKTDKNCDITGIESGNNLAKYGPYLCTGYDVYLSQEPCLMCAMALIHSRVKRIFFIKPSLENGALISRIKLHTVKELNHHYEVFQCTERNSKIDNIKDGR